MRVTLSQTVYRTLLIYSPTTGGLAAPDATPSASVIRNGTTDGAVTVTVTNVSTGRYKLSFAVPGTYAVDDVIELVATWAVSSVNGAALWAMQVDSTVDSRSSHTAAAVWAVGTRTLTSFGSLASDVWAVATRTLTAISDSSGVTTLLSRLTSTRADLLDNLDATVSSRSTYAGGDTAGTTTLLSRLTSTRAGYLDNLATAPPSSSAITTAVWAAATRSLTDKADFSLTSAYDAAKTAASATNLATAQTGITTLLTNTQDLPTLITGDGTAGAKFTTTALSNAPGGGGGALTTEQERMFCIIAGMMGFGTAVKTVVDRNTVSQTFTVPNIDLTDSGDEVTITIVKNSSSQQTATASIA